MKIAGTNIDDPATSGRSFDEIMASVSKSVASPDVAAFLTGTDIDDQQQGTKLVNPYAQSAWIFTAVSILASSIAQIPFRISRIGSDKAKRIRALRSSADPKHRALCRRALGNDIVDSGDVVELFNRPHPTMDRQLFWEMVVTWNALRGEFFILPLDGDDQPVDLSDRKPRIKRMLTLDTTLFWHMVQGYTLEAWRYTGSPLLTPLPSEMLLPTEVVHSRTPNPYLYWRGLSPLIVAGTPAQTDFAGEQFQKGLWVNNADTGVIVTTDQQATPTQRVEILAALRERKRKAGTADRPLFLWGGAKVEKPQLSMMDMQFLETRKFLRQEIFSIFRVPESFAGFTADLNDGGAGGSLDSVKISFIESTIGSLCAAIEAAVAPIVGTFGDDLIGWFDVDSLPIMQAARRARWETGSKMFAMGVPVGDINTSLDLGLPDQPWYKKGYLPFNLQVAGEPPEPLPSEGGDAATGDDKDQADEEKGSPFSRALGFLRLLSAPPAEVRKPDATALWKKHVAARKSSVKLFQGKVSKVLLKFRGKTLAKLDEVHLQKGATSYKDWEFAGKRSLTDIIFSANEFGDALATELNVPLRTVLQQAGEELNAEVGVDDPWEYPPQAVLEFLAARKQKIMGTGGTVRDQLNTSLMEGVEAGETHAQLVDRVKAVFNSLGDYEARRVAMTEVNIAYNTARQAAIKKAGIEFKAWLSSHGPHVRPAHAEAEAMYIDDPIPIDDPFEVMGEQLMFPGDDSLGASLENIINCQCIQLAAQKKSEDEKSVTYLVFGVGEMKFLKKAA